MKVFGTEGVPVNGIQKSFKQLVLEGKDLVEIVEELTPIAVIKGG